VQLVDALAAGRRDSPASAIFARSPSASAARTTLGGLVRTRRAYSTPPTPTQVCQPVAEVIRARAQSRSQAALAAAAAACACALVICPAARSASITASAAAYVSWAAARARSSCSSRVPLLSVPLSSTGDLQRAIGVLREEGLIVTYPGRGTFVAGRG